MGDGNVRRIAVILNGDTEQRHLKNVERAAKLFGEKGYDIYVASPAKPNVKTFQHTQPTSQGVAKIVSSLEGKTDDDDELIIYTTGHGRKGGGGCLVLRDGSLSKEDDIFQRLYALPHGKRTVIMSQCYAGNWARLFANDPKTLFVSAGSQNQSVCCEDFDPRFLENDKAIKDTNGDGTISWQERFGAALAHPQLAQPIFLPGRECQDTGVRGDNAEGPHFEARVYEATSIDKLKNLLGKLKPGDVAVIDFSAPWCEPCRAYKPRFDRLAHEAQGRALFIHIPNADDSQWDSMNIRAFPTITLASWDGKRVDVFNRNDPLAERWRLNSSPRRLSNLMTNRAKPTRSIKMPDMNELEVGSNKLLFNIGDKGSVGFRRGLVVGPAVETGWNSFSGPDIAFGARIGYGKHVAFEAPEVQGLRSASIYEEYAAEYRYLALSNSHRIGASWTMPSLKLFTSSKAIQLRIPFSVGVYGQFSTESSSGGCVPSEYVGIDEPQQCLPGVIKPPKGGGGAGLVRAMTGFDIIPYSAKVPLRFTAKIGPELGIGQRNGSTSLLAGVSLMLDLAWAI